MAQDLIIENEKFIHNIHCKVWDKRLEVVNFFQKVKHTDSTAISLYDLYILYMAWKRTAMKMSKKCFEKLAEEILGSSIDSSGVINTIFWKNCNTIV
jgi:transposase